MGVPCLKDLQQVAATVSPKDLDQIESYLGDYVCAKDPFYVQRGLYANHLDLIDADAEVFNSAQLTENVGECLWVLAICDKRFNKRRSIDAAVRFLRMAVVHTGGLNTLMFKRLLGRMLKIALEHQDGNAIKEFLAALAGAPCRAALYTEFDLNPFVKKNDDDGLMIIGQSGVEMELKPEHLLEFVAFNLGENYLLCFSKEERLALARKALGSPGMLRMVPEGFSHFVTSMTAPVASGWSISPGGAFTHWKSAALARRTPNAALGSMGKRTLKVRTKRTARMQLFDDPLQ